MGRTGPKRLSLAGLVKAEQWGTPMASIAEKGSYNMLPEKCNGRLQAQVTTLNADFVGCLMGYPPNWSNGLPVVANRKKHGSRHAQVLDGTQTGDIASAVSETQSCPPSATSPECESGS